MNVLFVMESAEYLRFYDDTIRELAARGHRVGVAVNKQRDKKPVRLEGVLAGNDRIALLGVVPRRDGVWRGISRGLRGFTDFARYFHPRLAQARALRARMKRKALPAVFRWIDAIPTLGAGGTRLLMRGLAALERAIPSDRRIESFIADHRADLVLVSPLVDAASDQVDFVKSAQRLGVPVAACIASWDNLTNKGALRLVPDRVVVWNEAQREEAVTFHGVPPARVAVTGAQVFDRWFARRPSTTREEFCAGAAIPAFPPFILFTCSSSFISLSEKEVPFVRAWIAAVRANPALASTPILIRPHPYNFAAWESADFSDLAAVAIWPRHPYNPIEESSRDGFFDSLFHCGAVVGINTSAMVESAILGKPVLTMVGGQFAGTQEGTLHFHHLLPENGGFLRVATTLPAHVAQLAQAMADPAAARAETDRFVRSFIRPHGRDVPATPALVDSLESLGAAGLTDKQPLPWWAPAAWPVLFVAGAAAAAWSLLSDDKARREARKAAVRGTRWILRQVGR